MESITEKGEEYLMISKSEHLEELVYLIDNTKPFADKFKFSDRAFFVNLLKSLKIDYDVFTEKNYYYNSITKLHISESESGYVWISTLGLVARGKKTTNRTVNSCLSQYVVLTLLFKKAIELVEDERVYDIDSNCSEQLTELSPAIFHNLIFYIEVFCKAYLSLTETQFPFTHRLPMLYKKTVEVMIDKKHNDSFFQILVLDRLYNFVDHIDKMPLDFKEHNVKYDDNLSDDSVILFDYKGFNEMISILDLSIDFITEYFYMGVKTHYLKTNVYQRMLDKAKTEEKRRRIKELYPHLASEK